MHNNTADKYNRQKSRASRISWFSPFTFITICCIGGWLLMPSVTWSQVLKDTYFHETAEKGLESMYNMEFSKAQKTFDQLKTEYPDHPGPHLMSALTLSWKLVLDERYTGYDADLLKEVESALSKNKTLKSNADLQVEYLVCELTGLTLKSRLQAIRGNWAASANTARKCIGLIKDCEKIKDESKEFLFYMGTYDYFVEAYPSKYPIVKPFMVFFPNGDRKKGMLELKGSAENRLMTQGEGAYQLALIFLDYERDYGKALRISRKLRNRFRSNSIFSLLYAVTLYQNKNYLEAEKILDKLEKTYTSIPGSAEKRIKPSQSIVTSRLMMEVYYYSGLVQMIEHKEEADAIRQLTRARKMARLCDFTDHDLYIGSLYHIAVAYDRMEERETALKLYDEVIRKDKSGGYKPRAKKCLEVPCQDDF